MSLIRLGHAFPASTRDTVEAIAIPESAVRIEKSGPVWTLIHSRPEERYAMNPATADALVAAFQSFDADSATDVAVLWGEGRAFWRARSQDDPQDGTTTDRQGHHDLRP